MKRFDFLKKLLNSSLISLTAILFLVYLISIFVLNFIGRPYVNFDIYSDAILSKYIITDHSLFPSGWHFGNQIYTVATPVIASFFYLIVHDSYVSLALASCLMTVLCVLSYYWCMKPLAKSSSIIVSLLVLIGGTTISYSAHSDWTGLQLFYTMASYYSCYIIGIFVTLGVFIRYWKKQKINYIVCSCVLLYNYALGMQSLRETLILNLPLLTVLSIMLMFLYAKKEKSVFGRYKSAILFSTFAFVFNICGVITTKILVTCNLINQTEMGVIKNVETHLSDRISTSVSSLLSFIGFVAPTSTFSILEITTALFTTVLVIAVLILIFTVTIRNNIHPQLTFIVLFFVIGITAVFISGLVFITLRPAYFFCWNLLTSVCVLYLIEFEPLKHQTYNNIKKDLLSV